jgi:hypothetical protein
MTGKAKTPKTLTTYVILERRQITLDPSDVADVAAAAGGRDVVAWIEVGEQQGPNDSAAIKAYAGVEGTGAFKAIPVRSWKGGLELKPVQQTEATPL